MNIGERYTLDFQAHLPRFDYFRSLKRPMSKSTLTISRFEEIVFNHFSHNSKILLNFLMLSNDFYSLMTSKGKNKYDFNSFLFGFDKILNIEICRLDFKLFVLLAILF